MNKYINLTGLSRFLAKCREVFYSKPSGGIPKNDLSTDVRDSLRTADALAEDVDYLLYYSLLMDDSIDPPYSAAEKAAGMENLGVPVRPGSGLDSVIQMVHDARFPNTATGARAASFGAKCSAPGANAFATGYDSTSHGVNSLTSGRGNTAKADNSFVGGIFSVVDDSVLFTMGIGSSASNRKNSLVIKTDGKVFIDGIGGYNGAQTLASQPNAQDVKTVLENSSPLVIENAISINTDPNISATYRITQAAYDQIAAAMSSGRPVFVKYSSPGPGDLTAPVVCVAPGEMAIKFYDDGYLVSAEMLYD